MKNKKILVALGIIWGLVFLLGIIYFQLEQTSKKINEVENIKIQRSKDEKGELEQRVFYIPNENFTALTTKKIEVLSSFDRAELIKKIAQKTFENLHELGILKTSQIGIRNIYIYEDTVYLDCDANLLEINEENRKNLLGVYSLVNSITELGNIRKVKILIDEKELDRGLLANMYTRNIEI